MDIWKPGVASWRVMCELPALSLDPEILYRPFRTLSFGERTKVMLAVLFSGENDFLLIDEATNHLDMASREIIKEYLTGKKGFILVSHDRDLLDASVDHVLVLNRSTIEVQKGNFVFSRMQIEALIERYKPTMLLVEHDVRFREKLAVKEVKL